MKRCIKTHHSRKFGEIPEGSLWEDDSPYIGKSECFEDVPDKRTKTAPAAANEDGEN